MMIQFSQMLSSIGFATLAIDEQGHGSSDAWYIYHSNNVKARRYFE